MKVHVRVETDNGQVLEFTDTDAESVSVSYSWDTEDVTPDGATVVERKLTTPRVTLEAVFPASAPPRWEATQ